MPMMSGVGISCQCSRRKRKSEIRIPEFRMKFAKSIQSGDMQIHDLGRMAYRQAWETQERAHEDVVAGAEERIFFVEHPPVITYGRRPGVDQHLVASPGQLAEQSVEIVQSDRGGDITFHGPGQLVAYPIIRL